MFSFLTGAEREIIPAEMREYLRLHVMEAWFPRCIDREAGGFYCDFDRQWNLHGEQTRMLEFQARQTRAAARLALAFPDDPLWAETALHGFRYLRDAMWDHKHGGWFWKIDRNGTPLENENKHAHGTAYAFQTCALVYKATKDLSALELALEAFSWFHHHAHDQEFGGYHNWMRRDGSVIGPADTSSNDPLGNQVGLKNLNVHGDWIEALTSFLEVHEDSKVMSTLRDLTSIFLRHFVTEDHGLHNNCFRNWKPQPGPEIIGYHLQASHRLVAAGKFLPELPDTGLVASRILNHAIDKGWTDLPAGFWYASPGGPPFTLEGVSLVVKRRTWWVQFEGMRALFLHALRPGESQSRHVELARRSWTWLRDSMQDPVHHGIYYAAPDDLAAMERPACATDNGKPWRKGDLWKDASHETDALLACMQVLGGGLA